MRTHYLTRIRQLLGHVPKHYYNLTTQQLKSEISNLIYLLR